MENKEFYIDKDGLKLHAKLDFPDGNEKRMPLVVVVHGLTGHMEENQIIGVAKAVTEIGYASLRIELYGHGKSGGTLENHNVLEWVNELIYVIDYVRALDFTTDIYLAGHSQGGLAVMLAAALKENQIKGIILISPAMIIVDSCKKGNFLGTEFDTKNIPHKIRFWDDKCVTENYIRIGRNLPIEQAIKDYCGPVLLIHSTKDEAVPLAYSIEAEKKYDNASLVQIPDDNHLYDMHLDMVQDAIKSFLVGHKN